MEIDEGRKRPESKYELEELGEGFGCKSGGKTS